MDFDVQETGYWWIPIFVMALTFPGVIVVFIPFVFMDFPNPGIIAEIYTLLVVIVLGSIWTISVIISPIAIHYDRKRISDLSEWAPSRWYYLTYLGPIGVFLTMEYIWRRHKYVGIP